jgi:hypothetical protein
MDTAIKKSLVLESIKESPTSELKIVESPVSYVTSDEEDDGTEKTESVHAGKGNRRSSIKISLRRLSTLKSEISKQSSAALKRVSMMPALSTLGALSKKRPSIAQFNRRATIRQPFQLSDMASCRMSIAEESIEEQQVE